MSYSDEGDLDCPLCMEEIDISDKYFKPCPCGYQICRFCWNHIKNNLNGLCPACRRPYSEDSIEFKPVPPEEVARLKNAKKKKERERKEHDLAARKQLANVRVVQKNLVYVLGLPPKLQNDEILRSHDYFGQYGKITKVVVNRRVQPHNVSMSPASNNNGVYVTYARKDDATRAIDAVDGSLCEGRVVRATYGTTKYCSYFLKNQPCQNVGCQFLHEPGEEADTYIKDETIRERSGQRLPPFPSTRREEKEETALPATVSWAKTIPLNNHKQFPTLSQQMGGMSDGDSESGSETHQQVPLDINDPRHYPALEPERSVVYGSDAHPHTSGKRRKQRTISEVVAPASNSQSSPVPSFESEVSPEVESHLETETASQSVQETSAFSASEQQLLSNTPPSDQTGNENTARSDPSVSPIIQVLGSKVLGGELLTPTHTTPVLSFDMPRQSLSKKERASFISATSLISSPVSVPDFLSEIGTRLVPCYSGMFDPFQPNPLMSLYAVSAATQSRPSFSAAAQTDNHPPQGSRMGSQDSPRNSVLDSSVSYGFNSTQEESRWNEGVDIDGAMSSLQSQTNHPGLTSRSHLRSSAGMSALSQSGGLLPSQTVSATASLSLRQQELLQHQQQQLNMINRLKIQQQQQFPHQQQLYARMAQQQLLNQYSQQQQTLGSTNLDAGYNAQYQLEQLRELQLRGQQQKLNRGGLGTENSQINLGDIVSHNRQRLFEKGQDDSVFLNDADMASQQQMSHFFKDLPQAGREELINGSLSQQQQQSMKNGNLDIMTKVSLARQQQQMLQQQQLLQQNPLGSARLQSFGKF